MNTEQFDKVLNSRLEKTRQVLGVKAKEYVRNGDRLHNFNVAAQRRGSTRERILDGYLLKHLMSYEDMLDDIEKGNLPSYSYIDEKIGDIINYFILQEACIVQTIKEHEAKVSTSKPAAGNGG